MQTNSSPSVAEFAESPDAYTVIPASFRRFITDRYVLLLGNTPHFTSVQRLRLAPDRIVQAVEEIRGLQTAYGHHSGIWWLGPSTTPDDLEERLRGLGFVTPPDRVGLLHAMTCTEEPEPGPPEIVARRVASLADLQLATEIRWDAFGTPPAKRAAERARLPEIWETERGEGIAITFLAFVDGEPAATALGVYAPPGCLLVGGATVPQARGRGAYRALVRARWDEAVRRGTPALVVHADPSTSAPILRRLGFEEVCELRRLEDPS